MEDWLTFYHRVCIFWLWPRLCRVWPHVPWAWRRRKKPPCTKYTGTTSSSWNEPWRQAIAFFFCNYDFFVTAWGGGRKRGPHLPAFVETTKRSAGFSTHAQSRFASFVLDSVLGPLYLAGQPWRRCPWFSVVLEARHESRQVEGTWRAPCQLKNPFKGLRQWRGSCWEDPKRTSGLLQTFSCLSLVI